MLNKVLVKTSNVCFAVFQSEKRSIEKLEDIEFLLLPLELKVLIAGFVTNFHSLMENLSIRLDCYSIGYFSSIISSELEQLHTARMRRKVVQLFIMFNSNIGSNIICFTNDHFYFIIR